MKKLLAASIAAAVLLVTVAVVQATTTEAPTNVTVPSTLTPWEKKVEKNIQKAIAKDRDKFKQAVEPLADTCARIQGEAIFVLVNPDCVAKVDDEVDTTVGVDVLEDGVTP